MFAALRNTTRVLCYTLLGILCHVSWDSFMRWGLQSHLRGSEGSLQPAEWQFLIYGLRSCDVQPWSTRGDHHGCEQECSVHAGVVEHW